MIILNKLFHSFILSSLGKINVDKRGTTHQKCRMSEKWNRSWNGERVAGRGSRVARHDKACKNLNMNMSVSRVYSIVVTVRKQVLAHSVVNFVGSHNFYRRDDFSIKTLWSWPYNSHEWPRQNFSLQYRCHISQMSYENKEKFPQFGDNRLIQY